MSILSFDSFRASNWHDNFSVGQKSHCPYCNIKVEHIFNAGDPGMDVSIDFDVWDCPKCGWWQYQYSWVSAWSGEPYLAQAISTLKQFEDNDINLPLEVLRKELIRKGDLLNTIHPKKMEDLAGAILKDFLNVEVHYCGASHDRGIDLLLLDGENTIPVQVKRRSKTDAVESVTTIREMFGVLYRDGYNKATIISTADHFSREAIKEVNEVIEKRACENFELIDKSKFLNMINATKTNALPSWTTECNRLFHVKPDFSTIKIRE